MLFRSHGNSLRALIKEIEGISDKDIVSVEIGTGVPIIYELSKSGDILKRYSL